MSSQRNSTSAASHYYLCLGGHFATWIASLDYTNVATSVVLVTTNPLFVGLGSALILGEKAPPSLWTGMLFAFSGCALVALGSPSDTAQASNPFLGNILALLGAVAMSGYLLIGRRLKDSVPTMTYVAIVYTVAASFLWAGAIVKASPLWGFSAKQWLFLILLALLPQGVGHTLINRSLKIIPASLVAVAILAEPLFATLLAIPILKEVPSGLQILGGVIVILGVALATGRGTDS